MPRIYSKEKLNYLKKNYNKVPAQELAEEFGLTVGGLKALAHRHGIKNPVTRQNEWTQEEIDLLIANNKGGIKAMMEALPNRSRHAINAKKEQLLQTLDLFDHDELMPDEVLAILDDVDPDADEYATCKEVSDKLKAIGYKVSYYLDAELYDLKKMKPQERGLAGSYIVKGKDVWNDYLKTGSENHSIDEDPMVDLEDQVVKTQYFKRILSIPELMKHDENLNEFIESEKADNFSNYKKGRKVKQNIIIGQTDYAKDVVIDGFHRIAQSIVNGEKEIRAFVPVNSKFA